MSSEEEEQEEALLLSSEVLVTAKDMTSWTEGIVDLTTPNSDQYQTRRSTSPPRVRTRRRRAILQTNPLPADELGLLISPSGYQSSPTPTRRKRKRTIRPSQLRRSQLDTTTRQQKKRRIIAPELMAEEEPPAILDKPREERSFREFFPDLNPTVPLEVVYKNTRLDDDMGSMSPLSDLSSEDMSEEMATPRRSIKLVFNDPEQPPPLRPQGSGKSAESYPGTPQSSVVVLQPKRPTFSLPETKFTQLPDSDATKLYGSKTFQRPETHYIRNTELNEHDLIERCEYDLEEVDREWLTLMTKQKILPDTLKASQLERILDVVEKTWFDLVKDTQKSITAMQQNQLPASESACSICGEDDVENANAIVYCDGCNLAVHQECYGVPYIPEGQWLCRKCMLSPDQDAHCILCPQRGGALKKTTNNKWAHVLCARWIPESDISNTVYMEPIDCIDQIPRSRWKLICHLCQRKSGACIQCSQRQCKVAFHATCGRRARLSMPMRADKATGETQFLAFCQRHTPQGHSQQVDVSEPLKYLGGKHRSMLNRVMMGLMKKKKKKKKEDEEEWPQSPMELLKGASGEIAKRFEKARKNDRRASIELTAEIFQPSRPVLNQFAVQQISQLPVLRRSSLAQRQQVIQTVAKLWALKRRSRHGAPLLKRLHLEPWTASATQHRALEMAEEQRQMFVRRLRTDLEKVRMLVESVRRRERDKLRRFRCQTEYLRKILDPITPLMLEVVEELMAKDPRGVLCQPVALEDAPDYLEIIERPMDFGSIRKKAREFGYKGDTEAFVQDLDLVVKNCMKYNRPTTYYYQLAWKIRAHVGRLGMELREKVKRLPICPETGRLLVNVDMEIFELSDKDIKEPEEESAEAVPMVTRSQLRKQQPQPKTPTPEPSSPEPLKEPAPELGPDELAAPIPRVIIEDPDSPVELGRPGRRSNLPLQQPLPNPYQGQPLPTAFLFKEQPYKYQHGTLVWVKPYSYPWFPAEIIDPSSDGIPQKILDHPRAKERGTLARFFKGRQGNRAWRWVSAQEVCRLGADKRLDLDFLRGKERRYPRGAIESIRTAYQEACTEGQMKPLVMVTKDDLY